METQIASNNKSGSNIGQKDVKKKAKRSSKSSEDNKSPGTSKKVGSSSSTQNENDNLKGTKSVMFPISEDPELADQILRKPTRRQKIIRHRSRTRQLNDKDGSGFSPPAYMTRTMSISDSIAPANKQERELSQGLLLDILETDSEDDIALKNLRKKLVADMKKEKVQGQSKVPALTKQDTDNLMEKLQRVESPPLKNNSHDQFDERESRKVALRQKQPQRVSQIRTHQVLKKESHNRDASQESSLIKTNSLTSESHSHSEVLNELKKIRNELSTLTSKQQELMNNIMKEISTAKQEILTKLEVEDKRQKKGSVPVVKKTKTSTVSSKKEEEKKSQMLANKEKDFVKSLEHTLDKTKKENAVLKKQLHELELKVKQLEMEADFWKSKYNEIVDSMLKNSSSN